tara:strand:- start:1466 stop:2812 length:1347 start_codon:yes stop_codon:yes gene_type:complete
MFKALKDKLTSWFSSSSKKIEETAEVETVEETKETQKELEEKADKLIEEAKKEDKEIPEKFNVGTQKYEPDLEKAKEEVEIAKKADKLIEKAKEEPHPQPHLRFDTTRRKAVPDLDKISGEAEAIKKEVKQAIKLEKEIKEVKENILDKQQSTEQLAEKPSFFSKLKSSFSYKITEQEFTNIFDDLEMLLLENNVALEVVEDLKTHLSKKLIDKEIKKQDLEDTIKKELKNSLREIIIEPDNPLELIRIASKPYVILFFGINGTGKTTSISKLANYLKKAGHSIVFAAADTFRAASIEQLSHHAEKLNIPIIKHDYGSDPAAVGFDAIKYAKANNIDVVLIDTAGRMHTKTNLIEEMKKIERVCNPNLKLFVAESIAGNDATEQAKTFHEAITIDGAILSKADIDEKGGTIISISHATNKPIFYLGIGQKYDDLELFNKDKFIESLGL